MKMMPTNETREGTNLSAPIFGPLQTVRPGVVLKAGKFISESTELARKNNTKILGQTAYDFYKKMCNWSLMPSNPEIKIVVFCGAQFLYGVEITHVRYLSRDAAGGWVGESSDIDYDFLGHCAAAVS